MSLPRLALIAGNGTLPGLFLDAVQKQGYEVLLMALTGEADAALAKKARFFHWISPARLGRMIALLQRYGITKLALLGGIQKQRLFQPQWYDFTTLRFLSKCLLHGDHHLLQALISFFEQHGLEIVDAKPFLPEIVCPVGNFYLSSQPTTEILEDLRYGFGIAKAIGALDIGQTVVVHQKVVIAVEGIEGTDACLQRAGKLLQGRGGVAVKVMKPQQDHRIDQPVIGPQTIETLKKAKIWTLGLEAGHTLLLHPKMIYEAAQQAGVTLIGLEATAPQVILQTHTLDNQDEPEKSLQRSTT